MTRTDAIKPHIIDALSIHEDAPFHLLMAVVLDGEWAADNVAFMAALPQLIEAGQVTESTKVDFIEGEQTIFNIAQ